MSLMSRPLPGSFLPGTRRWRRGHWQLERGGSQDWKCWRKWLCINRSMVTEVTNARELKSLTLKLYTFDSITSYPISSIPPKQNHRTHVPPARMARHVLLALSMARTAAATSAGADARPMDGLNLWFENMGRLLRLLDNYQNHGCINRLYNTICNDIYIYLNIIHIYIYIYISPENLQSFKNLIHMLLIINIMIMIMIIIIMIIIIIYHHHHHHQHHHHHRGHHSHHHRHPPRHHHLSSPIIIYHHLSSSIIIYHHLSSIIIYHHLSSIIIYHLSSIIIYHLSSIIYHLSSIIIFYLSSFIYHLSSIIYHHLSSIINHLSSIIYHLTSSFIFHHSSIIDHLSSSIIYHLSSIIYHLSSIIIIIIIIECFLKCCYTSKGCPWQPWLRIRCGKP